MYSKQISEPREAAKVGVAISNACDHRAVDMPSFRDKEELCIKDDDINAGSRRFSFARSFCVNKLWADGPGVRAHLAVIKGS